MTMLRVGVAIGALVGYALYAAASVARNGSLVRVDVSRELVLATFFVILLTALAPVIADSVGRTQRAYCRRWRPGSSMRMIAA